MRTFPRFVCKQLSLLVPGNRLFNTETPVFQPFYHVISDKKLPHILNYPYRSPIQFEKELDYILTYFRPVPIDYLLKEPDPQEKVFHLSFDDGLRECEETIAPILLKKGIPASFFVNSGFVDNKNLFHKYKASLILSELKRKRNTEAEDFLRISNIELTNILHTYIQKDNILNRAAELAGIDFTTFLKKQKPYLTTKQILNLKKQGFSIGAHSENHPELYKISEEEQFLEIKKSMDWLVENIDPQIKSFSFPFTDSGVSPNVLRKLFKEKICDVTFGTAGLKHDELDTHFQRYPVEQSGNFKLNLKSEWIYYKFRKIIGKEIVKH